MVGVGLRSVRLRLALQQFGYGGYGGGSVWGRCDWIGEEETTSRELAPLLDAALQGPKLTRREHPGMLASQTLEQLLHRPMWFSFQPLYDAGPSRLERVFPGAPVSWRSLAGTVRWSYLAGAPREFSTRTGSRARSCRWEAF